MSTKEPKKTPYNFLKKPFRNIWTRLLALFMAVFVWYAIVSMNSFESQIDNVPIRTLVSDNYAVLDLSVDDVDVYFEGSKDALLNLNREQLAIIVDLQSINEVGAIDIPLSADNIKAPSGAKATHFSPPVLTVMLDKKITRRLPIKLDIQEKLPANYEIAKTSVDPMTAEISGPALKINGLEWIKTEPIYVGSHTKTFRERVALAKPSTSWKAVLTPARINAQVSIIEHSETVDFEHIPVAALAPPGKAASISLSPPIVAVSVNGTEARLNQLQAADIRAFVDCRDLQLGSTYLLPIQLVLPEGIILNSITPDTASTTVSVPPPAPKSKESVFLKDLLNENK